MVFYERHNVKYDQTKQKQRKKTEIEAEILIRRHPQLSQIPFPKITSLTQWTIHTLQKFSLRENFLSFTRKTTIPISNTGYK